MLDLLNSSAWKLHHGDCIPHMGESMPADSIDFAVFSPPFNSVYAYTSEASDIGNSENLHGDAPLHLSFFYKQLARVLKPGRVAIVHVSQIVKMKRAGGQGLFDFRGLNIRIAERAGLIYEYDWSVRKDPQAQAIRNKAWELKFQGLESDRSGCRGALPDFLLKFRKPGENETVIANSEVTRNDWIRWAEHCWDDIITTDTLNAAEARGADDTKHIAPLQLEVIRRCILLFTNPDEIVFSPFAGIGSEGYMALGGSSPKTGRRIVEPRRFYGCELKHEYYRTATMNLAKAVKAADAQRQQDLFKSA